MQCMRVMRSYLSWFFEPMLMHWRKGDNELCIVAKENNNHEGCHRTPTKECHQFRLGLEFNVMGRFCMQIEIN
jgi:hypothetical protein